MIARESTRWPILPQIDLAGGGIDQMDASRQQRTAREVAARFMSQPGIVLADEVGMGKTFVALAVAISAARATSRPAVIMVPPRLFDKWDKEINRFQTLCLGNSGARGTTTTIRKELAITGADFLRHFEGSSQRPDLILLSNTAFYKEEKDPWIRLALISETLRRKKADRKSRCVIARVVPDVFSSKPIRILGPEGIEELFGRSVSRWKAYLSSTGLIEDSEPVPGGLLDVLTKDDAHSIMECIGHFPKRQSRHYDEHVRDARHEFKRVMKEVWRRLLHHARVSSPLLVFDEAHHLKNPSTRLASLFQDEESGDTSVIRGAFDRMLFLTATPFQLGHHELLEVLRRFLAIDWSTMESSRSNEVVQAELEGLGRHLDHAQREALHLDREWGRLEPGDLGLENGAELPDGWWNTILEGGGEEGQIETIRSRYLKARAAFREAESILRPWVIRHLRPRVIQGEEGAVPRRIELPGRSILDELPSKDGLLIEGEARFPFLLCARAQAMLAREGNRRAYFAEGLASSFGAFRETSQGERPTDDVDVDLDSHLPGSELDWYLDAVSRFVGRGRSKHPKVEATTQAVIRHWEEGEKVLVFCHYRKTVRDVRNRLNQEVKTRVRRLAARALRLPVTEQEEAIHRVERIVGRLQDRKSPLRRAVAQVLERWVEAAPVLSAGQKTQVVELLLRTLATESFVVRNFPLDREEVVLSLMDERPGATRARQAADAVADSLVRRRGRHLGYRSRVDSFLRHLSQDLCNRLERDELLEELMAARYGVVRHADGTVEPPIRRKVLLGFNSPLLPEILVASEVMAEGLDLHLDCRHVIHHDLSWNPSTLEQRTGRVDRLRCRAEVDRSSILIYLPYLEKTADEKMYRVVTDRARWFQVVMGESYKVDENTTDRYAQRILFPEEAAAGLAFDLSLAMP